MVEAALGGLGVALAQRAIVESDVASHRLQVPFALTSDGTDYGLIHPKALPLSNDLVVLRDWLLATSYSDGS